MKHTAKVKVSTQNPEPTGFATCDWSERHPGSSPVMHECCIPLPERIDIYSPGVCTRVIVCRGSMHPNGRKDPGLDSAVCVSVRMWSVMVEDIDGD